MMRKRHIARVLAAAILLIHADFFAWAEQAVANSTRAGTGQQNRHSVSGLINFKSLLQPHEGAAAKAAPAAARADSPVPAPQPAEEPAGQIALSADADRILDKALREEERQDLGNIPLLSGATYKPFLDREASTYKRIFDLQAAGQFDEADAMIASLRDERLMGHILHQRYMAPGYQAKFDELAGWMARYADQPGADKIYKMALARRPKGDTTRIEKPMMGKAIPPVREPTMVVAKKYVSPVARTPEQADAAEALRDKVERQIRSKAYSAAIETLNKDSRLSALDSVEQDLLKAQIAGGLLYSGDIARAFPLAVTAARRSGEKVPMANWAAGLMAWKKKDYKQAAGYFETVANSPYVAGWTSAAGAYWAARSHMRLGDVRVVSGWLKKAMEHPRTFYGLMATRAMGADFDFSWSIPTFTKAAYDRLVTQPAGYRALALVASGQIQRAEEELLRLQPEDRAMRDAMLAYANYAGLPSVAMRLASAVSGGQSSYYDMALYPTGAWEPQSGFDIEPALAYAIIRQESRFDPNATSPSGARGLMQLIPSTAAAMLREGDPVDGDKPSEWLANPAINLEVGQRYVQNLLKDRAVKGDLLSMVIAYNAGPGNLAKWKKIWPDVEDPLLFIELIPSGETRTYVERVLSNYWIYQMREGRPTPTLEAMAEGRPAMYAMDAGSSPIRLAASR